MAKFYDIWHPLRSKDITAEEKQNLSSKLVELQVRTSYSYAMTNLSSLNILSDIYFPLYDQSKRDLVRFTHQQAQRNCHQKVIILVDLMGILFRRGLLLCRVFDLCLNNNSFIRSGGSS